MQSYYINLDRATARRELIERQIVESNLDFTIERFAAINGESYKNTVDTLSAGQLGCWQSHLRLIETSLSNNEDLLIIEDDEYFSSKLNNLMHVKPSFDWDIIYLDATFVEIEDYLFISRSYHKNLSNGLRIIEIPSNSTVYGTHAYLINGEKKKKIFEILLKNSETGLPIDNVFAAAIQERRINAGITLPLLCAPGKETENSQINNQTHPLSKQWIEFRKSISAYNTMINNESFTSHLNQTTLDSIISRVGISIIEVFSPYLGKMNKLK